MNATNSVDSANPVNPAKNKRKRSKYIIVCLVLLAVGISIMIIGAILGGVRPITLGPNGFHVYSKQDLEELSIINKTFQNVDSIELKVAAFTSIEFVEGDEFSVRGQNLKINGELVAEEKNGTLAIYTKDKPWIRTGWHGFNLSPWIFTDKNVSKITITYPKGTNLKNVIVDMDVASDLSLNNLTCKNLELSSSVADVKMNTIEAEEIKIQMNTGDIHADRVSAGGIDIHNNAGDVDFSRTNVKRLTSKVNAGEFSFTGKILGDSYIDVDIGDIDMELNQAEETLGLTFDVSVGEVSINGRDVGSKYHRERAAGGKNETVAHLEIDANVSEVNIKFLE